MFNLKILTTAVMLLALGLPIVAQDLRQAAPLDPWGIKVSINGLAGQLAIQAGSTAWVDIGAGPGEAYALLVSVRSIPEDLFGFDGAVMMPGITNSAGIGGGALSVPDYAAGHTLMVRAVKLTPRGYVFSKETKVEVTFPPQFGPHNPTDGR